MSDAEAPPSPAPPEPAPPEPAPPSPAPPEPTGTGRVRTEVFAFLELAALCGLALAQPLLDITGKSPDFFLFYGAGATDVMALVALVVVVPPVALWTVGALSGLAGPRVRRAVHAVTVGALMAALAVQVGKQALPVRGLPLALLAVVAAAALVAAYVKWDGAKRVLRLAAVGPVVFVLLFVFASPASAVVLARHRTGAPAAGASGAQPPVVLIVFDELPLLSLVDGSGRIDARRFPNFARLAGTSTWYRNATGVSGWTPQAIPALLTGRYPHKEAAPHYSQYPDNLFTLLGTRYDLRVQESITQLCPPTFCERSAAERGGLPVMIEESAALLHDIVSPQERRKDPTASFREPTVAEGEAAGQEPPPSDPKFRWNALDDNQPVRFREFVTGLVPTARPTAHVLHLLMPHTPWRYLPSGVQYEAPEDLPTNGEWWPQLARQRHLEQLGYADRLLGHTLDALEFSNLLDESLVAVTADHGVSFTPPSVGRGLNEVRTSAAEVLWVPMFVKAPRQSAAVVDDRNWQHVDLVPTIADLAGLRVPWPVDGVSALGPPRPDTGKRYDDLPGAPVTVDGPAGLARIRSGAGPPLPPAPLPELIGAPTSRLAISDGGPRATVANLAAFAGIDPRTGTVPALVYGTVSASVAAGAPLAIAVNGRIGAVVPILPRAGKVPRFAGLITDESLFVPGKNRLELFLVTDGGTGLRRLLV